MKRSNNNGFLTFGGGISKGGRRHSVIDARLIDKEVAYGNL